MLRDCARRFEGRRGKTRKVIDTARRDTGPMAEALVALFRGEEHEAGPKEFAGAVALADVILLARKYFTGGK